MNVLISDNLGDVGVRMFREEEGINVDVKVGLSPSELKEIIGDYHALVIRSATKVTKEILQAAPKLKVVGRAGIGLDNVDVAEATKHGVVVMNTPGGNVVTTAEHAIAMMLSLTRNIPLGTSSLKEGRWIKKQLQGRELFNKVMGVIGFGKIGSIVADRARGLKMQVCIHDPFVNPEYIEKEGFESVSLDTLYNRADYISIHVPKLKETIGFVNKEAFARMKEGVMIINCSRGGIVDEKDLCEAVTSGKVAGAALDVFETEPPGKSPLMELDQIVCTPHLGASTLEAQTNVAVAIAGQIIDYLKTGTIINAVNVPSVTGELLQKLRPFLSLSDQISRLQTQFLQGPLKEVHIEYGGDFKGLDLSPISTAVLKGLLAPTAYDEVNFVNAKLIAKDRGIKVAETTNNDSDNYLNLITVKAITTEMTTTVAGTIFGKNDPRVVKIDNFRLEIIPKGHLALINNLDKPGVIGQIGSTLGKYNINISQMHVGQNEEGEMNVIFFKTDTLIPDLVVDELRALSSVTSVTLLEL